MTILAIHSIGNGSHGPLGAEVLSSMGNQISAIADFYAKTINGNLIFSRTRPAIGRTVG
jgi:hypothetical protein